MKYVLFVVYGLIAAQAYGQKFDGLAPTPPMGWNSWNAFGCDISETLIRETADAMVATGMRDVGYRYVNLDDCWQGERDAQGNIRPDPQRFPSGIKALADYVHAKGLKLGIYSDAGTKTCAGRPGSLGYELQDARTYAAWGIDYLKYDWCYTQGLNAPVAYRTMSQALLAAGRPIVLSICEWGVHQPWLWGSAVGHLWRTTGDIINCFDCVLQHDRWSSSGVMRILDKQQGLRIHAGPNQWNDPDMLQVGNGMTAAQNRAHFSMWAMIAAPLMAGNDLRRMPNETARVLTNHEVIALDQDVLGIQGFRYAVRDSVEVWFKPLAGDAWAMGLLNRAATPRTLTFNWEDETLADDLSMRTVRFDTTLYVLRDLWKKARIGTTQQPLTATIPGHDILLLRIHRPDEASLARPLAAYPNPSKGHFQVSLSLPEPGPLTMDVFDALGRHVQTRDLGHHVAGAQTVSILLPDAPPGLYYARFKAMAFQARSRLVVH